MLKSAALDASCDVIRDKSEFSGPVRGQSKSVAISSCVPGTYKNTRRKAETFLLSRYTAPICSQLSHWCTSEVQLHLVGLDVAVSSVLSTQAARCSHFYDRRLALTNAALFYLQREISLPTSQTTATKIQPVLQWACWRRAALAYRRDTHLGA